jgi:tetratricopeptide (TPR) repeat protein
MTRTKQGILLAATGCFLLIPPTTAPAQELGELQLTTFLGVDCFSDEERSTAAIQMRADLEEDPTDVDLWMRLGIQLAGTWHYQEAIDAYSEGLRRDPFNALLYRHRGHRFISTRRFEAAAADLELSSRLDPSNWDTWYHLGLACYLLGDFRAAADAYRQCYSLTDAADQGALVAVSDWLWMSLMRLGKAEAAAKLLEPIGPEMEVGENGSYHQRLLLYKGLLEPEEVFDVANEPLTVATNGYGVGNWFFVNGDHDTAFEVWELAVHNSNYWPAFGYIAAETEIKRERIRSWR